MNAKWFGWLVCLAPICAHAQSAQDVETVIAVESVDSSPIDSAIHRALVAPSAPYSQEVVANAVSTAATAATCLTDTTQSDFQAGTANNVDVDVSPGDVVLVGGDRLDQQNTTLGTSGVGITTTIWGGQTFTPSLTGHLTRVDINLFCSGCTGTTPNLTLSLRAASGGVPTGGDLASATVTGFSSGAAVFYTATFGTPATLTAGTQYAVVIRPTVNPSPGTYALTRSGTATAGSDVYAGGTRVAGATSGTVWSIPLTGGSSTDAGFKIYIDNGYDASGEFDSSIKDANPQPNANVTWTTLSWNAATPANTAMQFQIAGSASHSGPFNFVGPDNTSATYFNSGASLSQFNGLRYLKYRAVLSTSNTTTTPVLNDATVCYANLGPSDLAVTVTDGVTTAVPGGSVTYTITASNAGPADANGAGLGDNFPSTETCIWTCAGAGGGTCTASGSGNIADTINLPSGGSVTYTASCAISAAATGTLSNAATVTPPPNVTDPMLGNNSFTDTDTLTPQADLAITAIDGVTTAVPGGSVTYTITASNAGPSNAPGSTVVDTFPASLTCAWTCVGAGGGTCTASGSGNINDTTNLPAGGSTTYTASCTISASASGMLTNTATVSTPGGVTDPTPGNNSATDTDTLIAPADLAITKTHAGNFAQGQTGATYTLTASNAGGTPTSGTVTVTDTLPAGLTATAIGGTGWSCSLGTLTCTRSDALAASSSYPSITLTVNVADNAAASVTNNAAVSGGGETNTSNDTASDATTITPVTYAISGSVSGATSPAALTLSDSTHGTSQLLSSSGAFAFPTPLPIGSDWNVAVTTPPSGQTCVVANGTGTNLSADVTNVRVTCANILVTIAPATLAAGTFSAPYSQQLSASSGDGVDHSPYTFTPASGSLPPGLTLGTGGLLSGTPTAVGSYPFSVQAAGAGGVSGTQTYTLVVGKKTTTVTLVATPNPASAGVPVNLVATVAGDPPTGTVSFSDNGTPLPCSPVTLVSGATSSTAACTTTFTSGAHSITASYDGDANFVQAVSSVLAVTVAANVPAVAAPTLEHWAILMLCGLIGTVVFVRLRRLK